MKKAAYMPDFSSFIFKEAVRFLKGKRALAKEEYEKLEGHARARAFTVARYAEAEVLQQFLESVTDAVEQGKGLREFREGLDGWLEAHGYAGTDPSHAELVFRNNVQTAYNAGHYDSMMEVKRERPYWMYVTAGDASVRDSHAAMHGTVWEADDPVWNVWYPPNGHGCRCHVRSYTKRQAERRGLTVQKKPPVSVDADTGEIGMLMPDEGFAYNPARRDWKPDVSRFAPSVRKAFAVSRDGPV